MEMDNQFFSEIPVLYASGVAEPITDCGAGNYNIKIEDVVFENYVSQLETLSASGFIKYVDNGPAGLNGSVWTTTYTKDDLVVTVSYMKKRGCMYISAGKKLALSPHLFYDESYLKGNIAGSKTSLHMLELHTFGDSFVIQLKNGHFIMDDSGMPMDALYLLDYLEKLAPNGEKPIIEAWFISHGHVKLNEAGFEQVPTSSTWTHWYNTKETMELSRESISPELLIGHMTAPWQFTRPYARYMLLNDAYQFGEAKKAIYPLEG